MKTIFPLPSLLIFIHFDFAVACNGMSKAPIPAALPIERHGDGKCLHWEGQVFMSTFSNQTKRVHELAIGDRVLAYDTKIGFHTSPVVAILHRNLIDTREFVRIITAMGDQVSMTAEHGVYSGPCGEKGWKEKRADQVALGECVKTTNHVEDSIVALQSFADSGAVKPITETGSIVVDGVVVSCYDYEEKGQGAMINPHEFAQMYRTLYAVGEGLYNRLQGKFASGTLETLISYTGLEKFYV